MAQKEKHRGDAIDSSAQKDQTGTDPRRADSTASRERVARENVELMRRIRNGDEAALESLYDQYSGLVYAIALQVLGDHMDAEDTVIDTFHEVWQKADRYDPGRGSVVSYLLMLARSRAIDRRRKRGTGISANLAPDTAEALAEADATALDGHDEAADPVLSEHREKIRKLIGELKPAQREAIELAFLKGLSHREVAAALDEPLGTVKTRIRQGLIQLRDRFRMTDEGNNP